MKNKYFLELSGLGVDLDKYIRSAIVRSARKYDRILNYYNKSLQLASDEEWKELEEDMSISEYTSSLENEDLKIALSELPNELREVVRLSYLNDGKNKNVKKKLGISEVTLIKRKNAALMMLREKMTEH
ncbi:MAG: sigma-70 family RNA polymerase sigma factor [Firmicutes bacterium]|nr:sigma-70 family RNA polymerase sigma factor [Bacillota bacterium]